MIDGNIIAEAVAKTYERSAIFPSEDGLALMRDAYEKETNPNAKRAFETILNNIKLAADKYQPLCQTYATPAVHVYLGTNVRVKGNVIESIREGCRMATSRGFLRPSIVDSFTRRHVGNNVGLYVPDIEVELVSDSEVMEIVTFGTTTLPPSGVEVWLPQDAGKEGENIWKRVAKKVIEGGAMLCPPISVGVGIGGSLAIATRLTKLAALRGWTTRNKNPRVADWEEKLLRYINSLGIGPFGLGGDITCLAVNIELADSHAADLPVGVEFYCWACSLRRAQTQISARGNVKHLWR